MNIELLSDIYQIKYIKESDLQEVYELCKENPLYYEYCPPEVTIESLKHDLVVLPKGKESKDKHYIGFYQNNKLIAIMDLVLAYPNEETAFIGFFITGKASQGKGVGSSIITKACNYLKEIGFCKVRLGFAKGNPQSESFWTKNGFIKTGVEVPTENYDIVVMERQL